MTNQNYATPLIDCDALAAQLDDDDLIVVDCRFDLMQPDWGREQYQRSHLPHAVYAHLNEDLSAPVVSGVTGRHPLPAPEVFAQTLASWGISNRTHVVAYDDKGGMFAARLWWMLRWLGHDNVSVLDGGLVQWRNAGLPESAAAPLLQRASFVSSTQTEMRASVEQVEAAIVNSRITLLDARGADRYRGENETIDPVAGHIPTALSAPFMENLDAQGCFLPVEILRDRFQPMLGEQGTIVYCGSGVTAAHDVLAMARAGIESVKLYDGSWSHWITDPSRPVET